MKPEVEEELRGLRGMGIRFTMDGPEVADFVEKLDGVVEVEALEFSSPVLSVWVGEPRGADADSILSVIASSTLLNVVSAGLDVEGGGRRLWLEWHIPYYG